MTITLETSIFCPHGRVKSNCVVCDPPPMIGGKPAFNDGLLFVDRACRWRGQIVWHLTTATCACRNIPEHYVQVSVKDGAAWNDALVAMRRGARPVTTKRPGKKIVVVDAQTLYRYQCRVCWPRERRWDTEDGALDHLKNKHGIEPRNRIAEALKDGA